ncbi:MAG: hypothetical protein GF421_02765 [Candidatus Aminicenantes bacterium]|nr:hypothetical protein [Candidatus Aminicenantes bacterium]
MGIDIRDVVSRKDLRKFIYLPEKIHAEHEKWVHPIYMDEWSYFSPKKNRAFSYCDTVLSLAYNGNQCVGRIMGIINKRYNEYKNDNTARFGYLETWEDKQAVHALLDYVEEWARKKGMDRIIGPYGFTDQDPEGFLIEGFESTVTIPNYYNFKWMPGFLEDEGYEKDIDYVVYRIDVPEEVPEFYKKINKRIERRGEFEILEFEKRKELKPWIKPVLHLMNECYSQTNIYGYTPLEEDEMEALAKRYLPLLDPRFIKGVLRDKKLVAFIVGMPNPAEGIKKAKGRLFPFGILKILREIKKTKQLDLLLGGIKEEYRGRGLDVLMGIHMLKSAQEAGMEVMDTHHEMESNVKVRAEMERMGGEIYKKFRVYQKNL